MLDSTGIFSLQKSFFFTSNFFMNGVWKCLLAPEPVITATTNLIRGTKLSQKQTLLPYTNARTFVQLNIDKQVIGSIQTERRADGRTDGQCLERGGGSRGVGGMCVYRRAVNATACCLTSVACGQFQCCNGWIVLLAWREAYVCVSVGKKKDIGKLEQEKERKRMRLENVTSAENKTGKKGGKEVYFESVCM